MGKVINLSGYSQKACRLLSVLLFAGLLPLLGAKEIADVVFEQGNIFKFDEDVLRANVQSRKGGKYTEQSVNDDIKRLHAMGVFSDVVSVTREQPDGKIRIIFKIQPKPIVREIRFEGNKKYDEKKLREEIRIYPNAPLNDLALRNSADSLRKFYRSKGLNDAVIEPVFEKTDANHIRIIFKIKENLRYRVGKVFFRRNGKGEKIKVYKESELRDLIFNRNSFFSHPWFSWIFDHGLLDREELKRDRIRLRDHYWKKGYLDFRVLDVKLVPEKDNPELLHITFVVEEGEPYKVGKISYNGMKRFKAKELEELTLLKSGQNFSSTLEQRTLEQIDRKYSRLGYADLMVRAKRFPNYKTHKVDLEIELREGASYKINDIFISGNRFTKDYVILRELPVAPGDPVDKNMIKLARNRLMGMGYFDKVEAVSIHSEEGPADTRDVDIRLTEKRFIDGRIGATWSDSDGLSGMVELSHKNMDILDPKNYFTGGGQRMRALGVFGFDLYNFELDFTEPWLFGIPLRWDISGYFRNSAYKDWEEERLGVTTSLTKRIFDDFTTASVGYTFEKVRVHDMDRDMSYIFRKEKGSELVGRIHLSLSRDTRNSAMNPTKGYSIHGLASFTSQAFGGSNNYSRLELKGTYHYSFFDEMFVLSLGGKIGFLATIGDNDPVPIFERYFLGGGDSVRGFPYRSIGPEDYNGDNYGGQSMYIFTAEISHPIYSFIRGAAFVDIGDAGFKRYKFRTVNIGAGYGLRIKLPNFNAPLRLDLAFPVLNNQDDVKSRLRFHFNLGASFGPK